MDPVTTPILDTLADLAQPEPRAPRSRPSRTPRQTNETRTKVMRVVIVTAFFAILIGGNLIASASSILATVHDHFKPPDPSAQYKTARISRPMLDGIFCHSIVLDNKTGQSIEDKIERCDRDSQPRRGQTQFVWGGGK